jgi:flavin reductase (DIM6/NTAB) family NADH-FMN oxidoreductase RutF
MYAIRSSHLKINPSTFENFNRVLTGVVVPRPIAFVSSISADGIANLAPFSFFNAVSYSPPTIVFSAARHAGWKEKDTLANIEATGEFVVNIVSEEIAEAMNSTAAEYPADVDEFEIAGLTALPSDRIKSPRVAESPVSMECRLNQVVEIGEGDNSHGLVIAEVVLLHIRDDVINGHRIDQQKLKPVGRLAGSMYCSTLDTYEMFRPNYDPGQG